MTGVPEEHTAMVIGVGRSVGRTIAQTLAAHGASVAVADVRASSTSSRLRASTAAFEQATYCQHQGGPVRPHARRDGTRA
jgi:NAD(P)-dependent dehydrogenase (short-subunit alcohol dehydrogenase family)